MDVTSFLKKICDVLAEQDTSARDLEAIEFAADGRDISIRARREPHGSPYPPLPAVLGAIGRTCLEQGVAAPQLSRIAFLPHEVRVELAGGAHQPAKVILYPIEGTLGAPTGDLAPLSVERLRLISSRR